MSTELLERLQRLDPAPPDAEPPRGAVSAAVVLHEIDQRSGTMQTEERPTPATTRRRRVTGLLVAAAAFLVVLIIGIALVLLSGRGDEAPPATTPSTTTVTTVAPSTTQAPPTTEAPTTTQAEASVNTQQQAVVDEFFAALNDGDVDALSQLFSAGAEIGDGGPPGADQVNVIQPDERMAFFTWTILSLPTVYEVDSCEFVESTVSCRVSYSNNLLAAALGRPGSQNHVFDIEDGLIVRYYLTVPAIEGSVAYEPFFAWMEANHPEAVAVIWNVSCCGPEPILTEEGALLHAQLAEEYVATLDG